jgi:tetratricopeptide (TPR) repeat protein
LWQQAKYAEAEAAFRRAIALNPDLAPAHQGIGAAHFRRKQFPEAEAAFRKTLELDPGIHMARALLGNALTQQNKHAEAETAFRQAVEREPELFDARVNLGNAMIVQGKNREAEAVFRKSIDVRPDLLEAYYGLGAALINQRKHREAEPALRKYLDHNPKSGMAWRAFGIALAGQDRFPEAATAFMKAGALLPPEHPGREHAKKLLQQCQQYAALDAKLRAVQDGKEKPANAPEQIELARWCVRKRAYVAAVRFYRDAFTAEPKLAEAVPAPTRYDAACAAALAGCDQGSDADKVNDQKQALFRQQSLQWLRQDLAWWSKALDDGTEKTRAEVRKRMQHWLADGDLAGVRTRDSLARFPDAERVQWEKLWSEVDALLRRVR